MPIWGQSGAPTLVIRIDDLGALHSVNEACIQTYRSGIARSVEVMPVAAWYPEAIKMLKENPGLDVGLHLVITSEWENVKWRPLTHCPSLTDENGYFYPMMFPNPAYPGQSIMEQKWDIKEIEQEFRAQIETTLKSIPQLSHLSGHMLSTGFSKEVNELVQRLAKEYNLPSIDRMDSSKDYRFTYIGYDGPKRTAEEKEASFIKALEKLQPGQRYLFLDHPALDNDEMKTVFHIGYEDVALDRQGVTDLLTSPRVRKAIEDKGIKLISINQLTKGLPRAAATPKLDKAMNRYLDAVKKAGQDLHSIMIVQHGMTQVHLLQGFEIRLPSIVFSEIIISYLGTQNLIDGSIGGIARIRNQHLVARIAESQGNVQDAFLAAYQRLYLRSPVEVYIIPSLIEFCHCLSQFRNAHCGLISMCVGLLSHFAELVDGLLRRWHIWTSDGKADDVLSLGIELGYFFQFAAEVVFLYLGYSIGWLYHCI